MQTLIGKAIRRGGHPVWLRSAGEVMLVCVAVAVDLWVWGGETELRSGQSLPMWMVPAVTAVLYPFLLRRWRHPRAVFVAHWTYSLAGLLMPMFSPAAGLLVALYALARQESPRIAGAAVAMCAVSITVNSYNNADQATQGAYVVNFMGHWVLWSALTLTVGGLGRLAWAAERRTEQEKKELTASVVRAERLHLARELHDIVSHSVGAMILQAAGARTLASREDGQVQAALEAIETTGVQAMDELHRLLGLLRAVNPTEDHGGMNPSASLQDLDTVVGAARACGVEVEVLVDGYPAELDRSVGLAAYRVVQEALTNTIKYAGRGASSRIHLRWEAEGLTLTVRDRTGLKTAQRPELSSGHGLIGLTERITLVGGTLKVGEVADGYLVQAHLPTRPSTEHRIFPAA